MNPQSNSRTSLIFDYALDLIFIVSILFIPEGSIQMFAALIILIFPFGIELLQYALFLDSKNPYMAASYRSEDKQKIFRILKYVTFFFLAITATLYLSGEYETSFILYIAQFVVYLPLKTAGVFKKFRKLDKSKVSQMLFRFFALPFMLGAIVIIAMDLANIVVGPFVLVLVFVTVRKLVELQYYSSNINSNNPTKD